MTSQPENVLIVVAKKPVPGNTKTRLCPPLNFEQAAELYECFLRDTLDLMRRVPGVIHWVGYLPGEVRTSPSLNSQSGKEIDADSASIAYFHQLAPDMQLVCQLGASLGDRLDHLLTQALHNGAGRAVVMDSDSPTLPPEYLSQAFEKLQENDVVLGPTRDGGYYLIGMKKPHPYLLEVQMSTPNVLSDTLALANKFNLKVSLLPEWYDIDTVAELNQLHSELTSPGQQDAAVHTRRWLATLHTING